MLTSPRAFGVPHDEWRVGQFETVKFIAGARAGTVIVQAPTGSGKSASAAALQKYGVTRVLTNTINLQDQYADQYGFYPMYGLRNYPCELLRGNTMCDSCLYPEAMFQCPAKDYCIYIIERNNCRNSRTQVLSYAYYLRASWPKEHESRFLYLDEAHLLPNIIKDYCTVEYTPYELQADDLPMYDKVTIDNNAYRVKLAVKWLEEHIVKHLQAQHTKLMDIPPRRRSSRQARKLKLLGDRIIRLNMTIRYATLHPNDFYTWADDERFKLVPLTAKLYFNSLFIGRMQHKLILTSATIGNPQTLADELGINHFDFRDVPSAFSSEQMPVYTFKNMPRLGYKTSEKGWAKWAKKIGDLINDYDPSWPGLIHVSSKKQAMMLAESMARNGLQDRVYIPEGEGTSKKISNWHKRKKRVPNTIAVAYSFHMGLDAPDLKFNIIGKIPFKTLDRFGMAELQHNPSFYHLWAAILTEQAAGRIRRGEPEHYETPGRAVNKVVAIADGNYTRIQKQFSSHFKNCLTQYD